MASAAEQFASNINFGAFAKATELKKRLWFTLGALIIYRLGTYIPLPGIDPVVLKDIFTRNQGGVLGMFDMFAGGALSRMTIFVGQGPGPDHGRDYQENPLENVLIQEQAPCPGLVRHPDGQERLRENFRNIPNNPVGNG